MTLCSLDVVKKVCNYLNVSTGSLSYNSDKVVIRVSNKNSLEGFATVLRQIVSESPKGASQSFEEELAIYQWLEFAAMYANQAASNPAFAKTFLQEVNRNLECNSYITGHRCNVADVVWYHILHSILKNLTPAEKERLLHLCRWYDHLQGDDSLRQGSEVLNFATVHISHRLPASH